MRSRNLFSKKAFTLIEIMVVVGIIATIMSIAMPAFLRARLDARAAVCRANQRVLFEAAVTYGMFEGTSLKNVGGNKQQLAKLFNDGYIRGRAGFECPSSNVDDFDDYSISYDGDNPEDIQCTLEPKTHIWPVA